MKLETLNAQTIAGPFLSRWERIEVRVRCSAPNMAEILEA